MGRGSPFRWMRLFWNQGEVVVARAGESARCRRPAHLSVFRISLRERYLNKNALTVSLVGK